MGLLDTVAALEHRIKSLCGVALCQVSADIAHLNLPQNTSSLDPLCPTSPMPLLSTT